MSSYITDSGKSMNMVSDLMIHIDGESLEPVDLLKLGSGLYKIEVSNFDDFLKLNDSPISLHLMPKIK